MSVYSAGFAKQNLIQRQLLHRPGTGTENDSSEDEETNTEGS